MKFKQKKNTRTKKKIREKKEQISRLLFIKMHKYNDDNYMYC